MVSLEQMARAGLDVENFSLRNLAQDWLYQNADLSRCQPPQTADRYMLAMAASLVELFAHRRGQTPPAWTKSLRLSRSIHYPIMPDLIWDDLI